MAKSKLIIAHRSNLEGPKTAKYGENHPNSILHAQQLGFDCEVDVRWVDGKYYLGHDQPEYEVDKKFLSNHKLYIHCKTVETLYHLTPFPWTYIKIFFHQKDDVALIWNSELMWSFPRADVALTPKSVAVLPELVPEWKGLDICRGFCTDYPFKLQEDINFKSASLE